MRLVGAEVDFSRMWYELDAFWCSKLCLTSRVLTMLHKTMRSANVVWERYHQTGFPVNSSLRLANLKMFKEPLAEGVMACNGSRHCIVY